MSLLQAMRRNAVFRADETAVVDGGNDYGWRVLEDRVLRLATGISACGVGPGDRVGIMAFNSRYYLEAQLAIWSALAVEVPINVRWADAETLYALEDSAVDVLFVDEHFLDQALRLRGRRSRLRLILMGGPTVLGVGSSCEHLIATNERAASNEPDPGSVAAICYTGGTTGHAKGVMLSHGALWVNALSMAMATGVNGDDRLLHAAPLFHVAGAIMLNAGLVSGSTNVFVPRFEAPSAIEAIERCQVTRLLILPTMIQMMLEAPDYRPDRLGSLAALVFGGSPMPEPVLARLKAELPAVMLVHTYGQTEMGPVIAYLPARWQFVGSPKGLSVGIPFVSVEVKVVDPDGRSVPPRTPGEIWARGPGSMSGYLNKPEQTAATLTPDGWVRTGDVAYQDEDGFLYVCDRAKDMIITGGENVFSGEVENALVRHPAVREAAVVGIPDDRFGEAVHAVLVLQPGHSLDLEQLRSHCRTMIAPFKCPKSVEFRSHLPVSAAGKVLKRDLRAPFWPAPQLLQS